jgi:hypothetical protein
MDEGRDQERGAAVRQLDGVQLVGGQDGVEAAVASGKMPMKVGLAW